MGLKAQEGESNLVQECMKNGSSCPVDQGSQNHGAKSDMGSAGGSHEKGFTSCTRGLGPYCAGIGQ